MPISSNMSNINEIPKGSWWYSDINLNTKNVRDQVRDLDPKVIPGVGMVLIKTSDLYLPSCHIWTKIHQKVFKIWGLINFNTKTLTLWLFYENSWPWSQGCKFFYFYMKFLSLWPWPQGHTPGWGWCWVKLRPISTNMSNIHEIPQRVLMV